MNKKLKSLILLILGFSLLKYSYQALVLSPFEIDQEFLSLEAWQIIKDKNLTLIGAPTSVGGIFIGPLYTYLVTFFMAITNFHPFSVNILSALFAVSIPVLTFVFSTKLYSKTTGVIAAIFSTLSISFLSLLTVPPLVIPLALISLLVFYACSQLKTRPRALKYAALFSGFGLNLHFTALYLPIIVIIWMLLEKIKSSTSIIRRSIFLLLFTLSPLILFECRNRFFITKNFTSFITHHNSLNQSFIIRLFESLKLFLTSSGEMISFFDPINLFTGSVILVLFLLLFYKNKNNLNYRLLVLWLLLPVLLNGIYSGMLLPYYFIIVFPVFFIAAALVFEKLYQPKLRWGLLILFLFLGFRTIAWFVNFRNDFSLNHKIKAFEYIIDKAEPANINLSLNTEYSRRGGLEFLRLYYGFDKQILETRSTYSIIAPRNWHRMKPDVNYGEFGVINP